MPSKSERTEQAYELAKQQYADIGVDVDRALEVLSAIPISLHCWQGDDVGGFEQTGDELGGGLAVTGNYLGKARTPDELRADFEMALAVIPGRHRMNLHASYAETGGPRVERNELQPAHFQSWIQWAQRETAWCRLQPHLFLPPASGGRLHSRTPGSLDPSVLGGTRHRLPEDRRGHR